MKFPTKLKSLLEKSRMSQQDIADAMGISQGMVSRWTLGRNNPDYVQALALARILGVSLDYLADDAMDSPPALGISEDEAYLLRLIRDLGFEEAKQRLIHGRGLEAISGGRRATPPEERGSIPAKKSNAG